MVQEEGQDVDEVVMDFVSWIESEEGEIGLFGVGNLLLLGFETFCNGLGWKEVVNRLFMKSCGVSE